MRPCPLRRWNPCVSGAGRWGRWRSRRRRPGSCSPSSGCEPLPAEPGQAPLSAAPSPAPQAPPRTEAAPAGVDRSERVLHPALKGAVEAVLQDIRHEGHPSAKEGCILLKANSACGCLEALVDTTTHVVQVARHSAVTYQEARAILEVICQVIEGRPLQDASDHAAINALHRLSKGLGRRAVPGILLPTNAGRSFQDATALMRQLREQYGTQSGFTSTENFYEPPPSTAWQAQSGEQRLRQVAAAVREFEHERGLREGTLLVDRIEPDLLERAVRVVIGCDPEVPPQEKPVLIRQLERSLKQRVEETLQLHMEVLKDFNKIRRL